MVKKQQTKRIVLSIAGSDSGGGAGIQADLKAITALGAHALTAITAMTAQNSQGVTAVQCSTAAFLQAQLDALFSDFQVAAVKIGMVANSELIGVIAHTLTGFAGPIVLDPVMIATTGAALLDADATTALIEELIPLATVLTPNLPEAQALSGSSETGDALIRRLYALYRRPVLLKGGHDDGDNLVDRLFDSTTIHRYRSKRLPIRPHGTGCSLASLIATRLAQGVVLDRACADGIAILRTALQKSLCLGEGGLHIPDLQWRHRAYTSATDG